MCGDWRISSFYLNPTTWPRTKHLNLTSVIKNQALLNCSSTITAYIIHNTITVVLVAAEVMLIIMPLFSLLINHNYCTYIVSSLLCHLCWHMTHVIPRLLCFISTILTVYFSIVHYVRRH